MTALRFVSRLKFVRSTNSPTQLKEVCGKLLIVFQLSFWVKKCFDPPSRAAKPSPESVRPVDIWSEVRTNLGQL